MASSSAPRPQAGAPAVESPFAEGFGPPGQWAFAGAAGGAILGLTLGGPVGLVAGLVAGAAGGTFRDNTGRTVLEHYEQLPEEQRARLHRDLGTAQPSGQPEGASLTDAELEAIPSSAAQTDAVACKVCMESQVTVALRPCGHACLCAACALRLRGRSAGVQCPVCRQSVHGMQRVYL